MRFGTVYSTFGSPAYTHLFLESAKRFFPKIPILVHDDGNFDSVRNLAYKYGATYRGSPIRFGHQVGDVASMLAGLHWCSSQHHEILVKWSRRFIPKFDWTLDLENLLGSAKIYGAWWRIRDWKISTIYYAMVVSSWMPSINRYQQVLESRKPWGTFEKMVSDGFKDSEFREWILLGRKPVMWKMISTPLDYAIQAKSWGLNYTVHDFTLTLDQKCTNCGLGCKNPI